MISAKVSRSDRFIDNLVTVITCLLVENTVSVEGYVILPSYSQGKSIVLPKFCMRTFVNGVKLQSHDH